MLNVREINKTTELTAGKTKKAGSNESFASYLQGVPQQENLSLIHI